MQNAIRLWIACAAFATTPAAAQMISPMLYEGPRISLEAHARTTDAKTPDAPADEASAIFTRFAPSLARRQANYAQFVAKTRVADPAGADRLAALFASTDLIARMNGPLARFGLRTDDVADAYAVWWVNAWQATQGRNDDISVAATAAVKAQAARALAAAPAFAGESDAAKQEMAEALLIQAAMIHATVEQSKGKPDQLKAIGAAVATGAHAMGVDLDAMTLTEDGFRSTEETGGLADEDEAQATATATRSTGASGAPYLLLAAAGGAGLGAAYLLGRRMSRRA